MITALVQLHILDWQLTCLFSTTYWGKLVYELQHNVEKLRPEYSQVDI